MTAESGTERTPARLAAGTSITGTPNPLAASAPSAPIAPAPTTKKNGGPRSSNAATTVALSPPLPLSPSISPLPLIYLSLLSYRIPVETPIRDALSSQYDDDPSRLGALLARTVLPVPYMTLRAVFIPGKTREDTIRELQSSPGAAEMDVVPHGVLDDVILLRRRNYGGDAAGKGVAVSGSADTDDEPPEPPAHGWWWQRGGAPAVPRRPVVIVDRMCAEAVLCGADVFVPGVLGASAGASIGTGTEVDLYGEVAAAPPSGEGGAGRRRGRRRDRPHHTPRGMCAERYVGTAIYLGRGRSALSRADYFRETGGVAVTPTLVTRDGRTFVPRLPPLRGLLPDRVFAQHLPSACVAHVLAPGADDLVLDMCAAPGGKGTHAASIMAAQAAGGGRGAVVLCDRSQKKVEAMARRMDEMGVLRRGAPGGGNAVPAVMDSAAPCSEAGASHPLLDLLRQGAAAASAGSSTAESAAAGLPASANAPAEKYVVTPAPFPAQSFDRIILDPPCSALGLRPKLSLGPQMSSTADLNRHTVLQRRLARRAVALLRPGGIMTYSTCTINAGENEEMVRLILDDHPAMELIDAVVPGEGGERASGGDGGLGRWGLAKAGLTERERRMVRRFEATDVADSMGFFIAKFQKREDN